MNKADHQLVQRVLDGEVDREEFDLFQQRLREEPELVQLYGGYAVLHHILDEEAEGGGFRDFVEMEEGGVGKPLWIAGVLMMLLLAVVAMFRPWDRNAFDDIAVVSFSMDSVWRVEGTSERRANSVKVAPGTKLHLECGRAEAILDPLFTAVFEGPCEAVFVSGDRIRLLHGRGYFVRRNPGGLTVETDAITATSEGGAFGVVAQAPGTSELQVEHGDVRVVSKSTGETIISGAGRTIVAPPVGPFRTTDAADLAFARSVGRFETLVEDPFEPDAWRIEHGTPSVTPRRISGTNYAALAKLPETIPTESSPVMLATMEVAKSPENGFHTEGWAGISFFRGEEEIVFFGDSFGTRETWSLDTKQRIPVIYPEHDVVGPLKVTLRYDRRSGEASLHEHGSPLGPAFCRGTLPPGAVFDTVRLGASAGASLDVTGLEIRVGGGR